MSRSAALALTLTVLASPLAASSPESDAAPVPLTMERITAAAMVDSSAYRLLEELCDVAGPRLSGSANYEAAVDWALQHLHEAGLVNVRREPVTVPHWVRGDESAWLLAPHAARLTMIGLGGSVGTPPGGLEAHVLAVRDFDELAARADEADGKIVLFDPPSHNTRNAKRTRIERNTQSSHAIINHLHQKMATAAILDHALMDKSCKHRIQRLM